MFLSVSVCVWVHACIPRWAHVPTETETGIDAGCPGPGAAAGCEPPDNKDGNQTQVSCKSRKLFDRHAISPALHFICCIQKQREKWKSTCLYGELKFKNLSFELSCGNGMIDPLTWLLSHEHGRLVFAVYMYICQLKLEELQRRNKN